MENFSNNISEFLNEIDLIMFRKTMWRKAVSEAVSSHQHRALNTTIFILKEFGPIGFLLKEDGDSKNYKVSLHWFLLLLLFDTFLMYFVQFINAISYIRCVWEIHTRVPALPSRKRRIFARTSAGNALGWTLDQCFFNNGHFYPVDI